MSGCILNIFTHPAFLSRAISCVHVYRSCRSFISRTKENDPVGEWTYSRIFYSSCVLFWVLKSISISSHLHEDFDFNPAQWMTNVGIKQSMYCRNYIKYVFGFGIFKVLVKGHFDSDWNLVYWLYQSLVMMCFCFVLKCLQDECFQDCLQQWNVFCK